MSESVHLHTVHLQDMTPHWMLLVLLVFLQYYRIAIALGYIVTFTKVLIRHGS
jgi:hypothetical protein